MYDEHLYTTSRDVTEDRNVSLGETVQSFAELVTSGCVRALGVSNHSMWRIVRAAESTRERGIPGYTCMQQLHTYLTPRPRADTWPEQHVADGELLNYCRSNPSMTLLAYSLLLKGSYSHPERLPSYFEHPDTQSRLRILRQLSAELDVTPNQLVLAWLLRSDPRVIPVFSVSSVSQLDECLTAADLRLDDNIWQRLSRT